jgi:hypothetical protein
VPWFLRLLEEKRGPDISKKKIPKQNVHYFKFSTHIYTHRMPLPTQSEVILHCVQSNYRTQLHTNPCALRACQLLVGCRFRVGKWFPKRKGTSKRKEKKKEKGQCISVASHT